MTALYFDDGANWEVARQRLRKALRAAGLADQADVSYQPVETPEAAERAGFRGSLTIVVDGRDPWADDGTPGALSSRIYGTEYCPDGAPSVAQLAEALAR